MPKLSTFLKKLLSMLNDPSLAETISWRQDGNSFQIHKMGQFADHVLPHYFKHNNVASFVRQLNMYGFSRPKDSDQHAYFHASFKRGSENAIRCIKRKRRQRNSDHSESLDRFQQGLSSELSKSQKGNKWVRECQKLKKINDELKLENEALAKKLVEFRKVQKLLVKVEEKQKKNNQEKHPQENGSLNKSTEGTGVPNHPKKDQKIFHIQPTQKRCCVLVLQGPRTKSTQL